MANLFGAIGLSESDRLFNGTIQQGVIYEETQKFLDIYNTDLANAIAIFVDGKTDRIKERYRLPGNGYMQRRGRSSAPGAVKASGSFDVGYPLIDFGDALSADDVTMAYMTAHEYSLHLQSITNRDVNTYRFELLRALFNGSSYTFSDEVLGDVTVQPLANGDATLYPPTLGTTADATASMYAGSNYVSSGITDSNNPVKTIVAALQARWGTPTGGSNIAVFVNPAEATMIQGLTDFVKVQYHLVHPGVNTATVDIPGVDNRLLGASWEVIGTCSGATICKWAYIPAGYMAGVHLDAPPPLVERIDPADTGLGSGLQLVAKDMDVIFETAFWRHRYGLGVRNRLNGYVLQLVASTSYTAPAIYA
jgi:hypothetical protein